MSALNSPAAGWVPVSPNDSADLPGGPCRGIWINGGSGNIQVTDVMGNTNILNGLSAAVEYGGRFKRIWSTGTSATSILALY